MSKNQFWRVLLLLGIIVPLHGCGDSGVAHLAEFQERNESNVAKVRTCFQMYASRHQWKSPKNKEDLVAFLESGEVDKNLKRLGVDLLGIEDLFISERDGEPLKIKWGVRSNPGTPTPVAFESVGVDGIRLVAADVVIEVQGDNQYDRLWNGDYKPEKLDTDNRDF